MHVFDVLFRCCDEDYDVDVVDEGKLPLNTVEDDFWGASKGFGSIVKFTGHTGESV